VNRLSHVRERAIAVVFQLVDECRIVERFGATSLMGQESLKRLAEPLAAAA
jgi:hypothetical protein